MKKNIDLRQPILINNQKYEQLSYDFDELTCEDFSTAAAFAEAKNFKANQAGRPSILLMEQNENLHLYLAFMAVIAVNREIDIVDLERIKGFDILQLASVGRLFTLGRLEEVSDQSDSEEQSENTPEDTTPESEK